MVTIKGREYSPVVVRDSHARRAMQFRNNLLEKFRKIGLTEDDVEIPMENIAFKRAPASAMWWLDGQHQYYSYSAGMNFAENMNMVSRVIEAELNALLNEEITLRDFVDKFKEDKNIEEARKEARETLGLEYDEKDMEKINKIYKDLARKHHPDAGGDKEKFQKINSAHKMLKRELE